MLKNLFFIFVFCGILGACSDKSPKLLPLQKVDTETKTEVAPIGENSFKPKLDILFVIDDSGSMQEHQTNLANNVDKFADAIIRTKYLDYHIGVITSSNPNYYWGGGSGNCCGRLVGSPRYVERTTVNGLGILANNMRVGTSGDATEKFFDPIYLALTDPLLNGYNIDFYREDASLAIILITDTEDQSEDMTAQSLYNFLLTLKKSPDRIFAAAAHIPKNEIKACSGETSEVMAYNGINDFLALTKGSEFSLCSDFGKELADLGDQIASRSQIMYLTKIPNPKTIEITMGGIKMPEDVSKGWSYDANKNAIVFGANIEWSLYPDNTFPKITFEVIPQKPEGIK